MELHDEDQSTQKPVQLTRKTKEHAYSFSHKLLYIILAAVLVIVGTVATLLCRAQVRYTEQTILAEHRDAEQLWVDTTLDTIRAWQTKSLETIRYVSQAEMFRLFAKDVQTLQESNGQGDDLRSMGEERDYLVDLLLDTARRRGWQRARILSAQGKDLVASDDYSPIREEVTKLLEKARSQRGAVYSGLYLEQGQIFMDVIDPLYEVQSMEEPAIVGFLVTTLPMEERLSEFLSEERLKSSSYVPKILAEGHDCIMVVQLVGGKPAFCGDCFLSIHKNISFERRNAFGSNEGNPESVYSLGSHLPLPPWHIVLECDAESVDQELWNSAKEIYGLGVLGSLALALFFAMILGTWIVRHKAKEEQKCIGGLVHAIECALDGSDAKFRYLQGRSHKVAKLSTRLGKQLKLSGQAMENMQLAARLSQVGKIFVPRDI